MKPRAIVHLDGDAFFAAVEQAADPRLRGRPVAVGGEQRGVIASASYEARKFGLKAAMPTALARKLCPGLIVIPGDYERYEQFSRLMFSYAEDHTPLVEVQGLDEGYYDLTGNTQKPPDEIAQTVQRAIRQTLKITVSKGLGTNKLVSQIASKAHKPAGFHMIPAGAERSFLDPLPLGWLPGVGPKLALRMKSAGLHQIHQVAGMPMDLLELMVGSQARLLLGFARGQDDRPVIPERLPQKSYSSQETFPADVIDEVFVEATLRRMADTLCSQLRAEERTARTLGIVLQYNDHDRSQCSESLPEPTCLETDLYSRIHTLMRRAWKRRVSLRQVGLKLSNLYHDRFTGELDLPGERASQERQERVLRAVDGLRRRFGQTVILRGHDFILGAGPRDPVRSPVSPTPRRPRPIRTVTPADFVPLACHSHYSFLDSTLSPQQVVTLARSAGAPAVALTDLGNLHGAGEFAQAARAQGIRPIFGAEVDTVDGPLRLYVQNPTGYSNLCRLLSGLGDGEGQGDEAVVATRQRGKLDHRQIANHADGLLAVGGTDVFQPVFGSRFYRAVTHRDLSGHPRGILIPRVHYASAEDHRQHDILQSIRTRTLLSQPHPEKRKGDLHFRDIRQLPVWCPPELVLRTRELAESCEFAFPFGKPQFPEFHPPDGSSPRGFLRHLVMAGLRRRYGDRADVLRGQVEQELGIIAAVGYEDLFLHTWTLLQDCRVVGIDWITRGSAADSLVCYCLEISNVCPIRFELYFKRFLNPERMALNKLPDIDIDFPHDRKDDVVRLLLDRFGPEHSAIVGGFSTFQARSAFSEVGKVLGLSEGQVRRFTERFPWRLGPDLKATLEAGVETQDLPLQEEPYRSALELAMRLDGRPRYPKMHPCGVVLSRQPLHQLTPTFRSNKGWPTTHLDMDAIESVGLVKMDILAQGGLAVLRDAREAIRVHQGVEVDWNALEPWEDSMTWDLIAGGGSRAVHHIESPAMLNLCRQTRVREIDGLVAIVSVIRPGAANENKKLAFTRRYQGLESAVYPHPCLEPCLRSTFGLVVYEEHILQIAEVYAGLSGGRADQLRRALVKEKREMVEEIRPEFLAGAAALGRPPDTTAEVWELLTGFQGYAFNKAHSTAYGVEAFQAAWIKSRYPAEFMASVLTHGKGFYSRLVYILECHRLGLRILPPTVNDPGPAFVVRQGAIRVPVTQMQGLGESTRMRLLSEHRRRSFRDLADLLRRVGPTADELEALMRVGALDEFGKSRTELFWEIQQRARASVDARQPDQGWLFPPAPVDALPHGLLNEPSRRERLQAEWDLLGFTVSAHPLELHDTIHWSSYCPLSQAGKYLGQEITVCGLVIEQRLHHQVNGEPMKFLTLADHTEMASTDLFAATYRSYGLATVRYPVLEVTARVEPFENNNGWTLRVLRAGKPRTH